MSGAATRVERAPLANGATMSRLIKGGWQLGDGHGDKPDPRQAMADMAAKLKPDEMVALGKYFEKIAVPAEPAKDGELAAVGRYIFHTGNKYSAVPACASCHGKEGLGTSQLPRLAGQYSSYIEGQLKSFGNRERTNDNAVMHTIASKMTAQEMAAVAQYLAGQ